MPRLALVIVKRKPGAVDDLMDVLIVSAIFPISFALYFDCVVHIASYTKDYSRNYVLVSLCIHHLVQCFIGFSLTNRKRFQHGVAHTSFHDYMTLHLGHEVGKNSWIDSRHRHRVVII